MASREFREQLSWEDKAKSNPLFAVMSVDAFGDSGAPTPEELEQFFQDGELKAQRWLLPWLDELQTNQHHRILEFGCGMARLLRPLADRYPAEHLIGIDISPTMIEHARSNLPAAVQLHATSSDFPCPDESIDRVYSYAVFQHIACKSDVLNAISEICRVLKPGGRLKIQFAMAGHPPWVLGSDTFALETSYLVHGWTRRFGIPLWRARLIRSNNWDGIRLGYRQLVKAFDRGGVSIYGLAQEFPQRGFVWLFGAKR